LLTLTRNYITFVTILTLISSRGSVHTLRKVKWIMLRLSDVCLSHTLGLIENREA